MTLFDYSKKKELARFLLEAPEFYNNVKTTLNKPKGQGVLSQEQEGALEKDLEFLEQANNIATESDYYIFRVEDGWTNYQGGDEGFEIYQNIEGKLVPILTIIGEGIPSQERVLKKLKEKGVTKLYTKHIGTGKYLGLEGWEDDGDGYGRWYRELYKETISKFKEKGFEVIVLKSS